MVRDLMPFRLRAPRRVTRGREQRRVERLSSREGLLLSHSHSTAHGVWTEAQLDRLIAEAFVKTCKRGYVRVHPLPDAATVIRLIANWFDDYNESHPHSGARNDLPKEFNRT
jgi:transposase InsO family protein